MRAQNRLIAMLTHDDAVYFVAFFAVLTPDKIVDYEAQEAQQGFAVLFGYDAMGRFGQV